MTKIFVNFLGSFVINHYFCTRKHNDFIDGTIIRILFFLLLLF